MRIGPYEVEGELGRGGMGVVYAARSPEGRRVALKVTPAAGWDEAHRRALREVRLQSALGEAGGFVPILDSGEEPGRVWLAMPLLGGGTLRDRLRRGPLPRARPSS